MDAWKRLQSATATDLAALHYLNDNGWKNITQRHGEGANMLYVDGHVKKYHQPQSALVSDARSILY